MQKRGKMEYTWHTLVWLLPAFTFSTQGLVKLSTSPGITAECGERVTLNCNASSSQKDLSIKHIEWFQSHTSVCSVNEKGEVRNHAPSLTDFYCDYKHGRLSLIIQRVKPLDRGNYSCKLHSNQGTGNSNTRVELQECGKAKGFWTKDRLTCAFTNVYPDGEVHWFHGHRNLSDGSVRHNTSKQVDEGGWLTIRSDLERESSLVAYNCSLMSAASGRYVASTLVPNPESRRVPGQELTPQSHSGVGSNGPMWTCLFSAVFLAATLN
ncbi:uncharacterized protein LOC119218556 [Pungitius pungitius]|uniref:uncharacterized protein LOC119218556 n=1 Tax=Pungitius pungitius TaxID=134920 RepID=UPI002E166664